MNDGAAERLEKDEPRCRWAIEYGTTLASRCRLSGPHVEHVAKGLAGFPYQTVHWFDGDRRQFLTDRADEYSWETVFVLPEAQKDGSVVWRGASGTPVEEWHEPHD